MRASNGRQNAPLGAVALPVEPVAESPAARLAPGVLQVLDAGGVAGDDVAVGVGEGVLAKELARIAAAVGEVCVKGLNCPS